MWRKKLLMACQEQNACKAVRDVRESMAEENIEEGTEMALVRESTSLVLNCLRQASWRREQLWTAVSARDRARDAYDYARQAGGFIGQLPYSFAAKGWCPRTSADLLGSVALSRPFRLLKSLVATVLVRPTFLDAGVPAIPSFDRHATA